MEYSLERQPSTIPAGQPEPEQNRQAESSSEESLTDSEAEYALFGEGGDSVGNSVAPPAVETHLQPEVEKPRIGRTIEQVADSPTQVEGFGQELYADARVVQDLQNKVRVTHEQQNKVRAAHEQLTSPPDSEEWAQLGVAVQNFVPGTLIQLDTALGKFVPATFGNMAAKMDGVETTYPPEIEKIRQDMLTSGAASWQISSFLHQAGGEQRTQQAIGELSGKVEQVSTTVGILSSDVKNLKLGHKVLEERVEGIIAGTISIAGTGASSTGSEAGTGGTRGNQGGGGQSVEDEQQDRSKLVLMFCKYQEKDAKGIDSKALDLCRTGLQAKFKNEVWKGIFEESLWEPGGLRMFSATVRVPQDLINQSQLIKDAFQQTLEMTDGWHQTAVMYPKTRGQRKRGAVIAIACQYAQEKWADGVREKVSVKYNPTRIVVQTGTGDLVVINVNREFSRAKVTFEAADALRKEPGDLQTELDTWLE